MRSRPRPSVLALLAVVAAVGSALRAARPVGAEEAPLAPWEREVETEIAEQDRLIEEARSRGTGFGSVVTRYASRLSRDGRPLNHYLLGRVLWHNKDAGGARAQMEAALSQDPKFWYAHRGLAKIHLEPPKNPAKVEAHARAILAAKPSHRDAIGMLAELAIDAKDWDKALRLLDELLARNARDVFVREMIVSVRMMKGDWAGAAGELKTLRGMDPANAKYRVTYARTLFEQGDLTGAAKEAEELSRAEPQNLPAAHLLAKIHFARKDGDALRAAYERMLPLVPPGERKELSEAIERLKKGPLPEAPAGAEAERPKRTVDDLWRDARGDDVERRREAFQTIYEAINAGFLKNGPWSDVLRHVVPHYEPDVRCRSWAVRIAARFPGETALFYLSTALADPERDVRFLAIEELGDSGEPAAYAYLAPQLDLLDDLVELNAVRAALTAATGFRDFPSDVVVATAADASAAREAWRRWALSDASRDLKVAAVRQVARIKTSRLEWHLVWFVRDPTFDVFREAYVALRAVCEGPPQDLVDRAMYPRFPRRADAELARESMRALQDQVDAWWKEWLVERRAFLSSTPGK
jgi:tetratricopeptide (TPR) repeat protein